MTRDEAIKLAAMLHVYWPRWTLPDNDDEVDLTLGAWCRLCSDVSGDAMIAALDALAASGEAFPPAIGAVRKQALDLIGRADGTALPDLDQAWAEVQRAISARGFMAGPPEWSHPSIKGAVDAITWRRLCLDENQSSLLAQFRDCWRPAAARTEAERILPEAARALVGGDLARTLAGRMRELEG